MSEERKGVIAELVKEVGEINNIAVLRFILNVVKSFKEDKKWGVQYDE